MHPQTRSITWAGYEKPCYVLDNIVIVKLNFVSLVRRKILLEEPVSCKKNLKVAEFTEKPPQTQKITFSLVQGSL